MGIQIGTLIVVGENSFELEIIDNKDADGMKGYLTKIRNHVKRDIEIKKQ